MYDQSIEALRAREGRDFWRSSAERWRAAFDYVVSALDAEDPDTRAVLDEAERLRESIPLKYERAPLDV